MVNVGSVQRMQDFVASMGDKKIGQDGFVALKAMAMTDETLDQSEATFFMDKVANQKFEETTVPSVHKFLSSGFSSDTNESQEDLGIAFIGRNRYDNIRRVSKDFKLDQLKTITDDNNIDEVYFKDDKGQLYVAYGKEEDKGALDFNGVKTNFVGRFQGKKVTVIHTNNETNSFWEGAKSPWVSTYETVKKAGESAIVQGVGLAVGFVMMGLVGKGSFAAASEKTLAAAQAATAQKTVETAVKAAETAAKASGAEAAKAAETAVKAVKELGALGKAKNFGEATMKTVGSKLSTVATNAAITGAVIGTVIGGVSVIGAIRGATVDNDYVTIDMVTGKNLYYFPETQNAAAEAKE